MHWQMVVCPRVLAHPVMCSLAALALFLLVAGCAERPRIGITITNAPTIPDCIEGSATKPCP
jgi:hypothetical protein